ncbi:hypothetical protein ACWGPT_11340 [Pseudorhizobium sp. NPDC055634]
MPDKTRKAGAVAPATKKNTSEVKQKRRPKNLPFAAAPPKKGKR